VRRREEQQDGRVYFWADSDAIITKGIVSVLIRAFSGLSAQDIVNAPTDFIKEIGLNDHLSPTRANGLVSMIKQMKLYATAFAAQNNV
jgi:cysteine desulfuration protein SufE